MNEKKIEDGNIERFFENVEGKQTTYQYQCPQCSHITEEEFPFAQPELTVQCRNPECENGIATKIISTPNILVGIPTHSARKGRGQG